MCLTTSGPGWAPLTAHLRFKTAVPLWRHSGILGQERAFLMSASILYSPASWSLCE